MHKKLLRTAEFLGLKLKTCAKPDNCSYGTERSELASHATKGVGNKKLEGTSGHWSR